MPSGHHMFLVSDPSGWASVAQSHIDASSLTLRCFPRLWFCPLLLLTWQFPTGGSSKHSLLACSKGFMGLSMKKKRLFQVLFLSLLYKDKYPRTELGVHLNNSLLAVLRIPMLQ